MRIESPQAINNLGTVFIPVTNADDAATTVLSQTDGKLIVVGHAFPGTGGGYDFAVCRRNADGSLDTSFGNGTGQTVVAMGSNNDYAQSAALQADGKIVVAGYSFNAVAGIDEFSVLRLNSNGSLDTSFGNGTGKVLVPVNSTATAFAVSVQADGKIVLAGTSYGSTASTGNDFTVLRLSANGALDTGFGNGSGKVILAVAGGNDFGHALNLQKDGKILVTGSFGAGDFGAARLNADGSVDTGFAGSGFADVAVGSFGVASAYASALQADGKILIAGLANDPATDRKSFAVVRLDSDGQIDSSFGKLGQALIPVADMDSGRSILVQTDGKILVGGYSRVDPAPFVTGDAVFVVTRLNADGTPDISFGQAGKVLAAVGARDAYAYSMVLQSDGKIVVAGDAINPSVPSGHDFALLRLNTNGSIDTSFGATGSAGITRTGTDVADHLDGGPGNDSLSALGGDDTLAGLGGSDTLNGGAGLDVAVYAGSRANFSLTRSATDQWSAKDNTGLEGTDLLVSVERLQFSDRAVALDLSPSGNAAQAVEYLGVLAPSVLKDASVFGAILGYVDDGLSLNDLFRITVDVGLAAQLAGTSSNAGLVRYIFRNIVGTEAPADTVDVLVSFMDGRSASLSQADFLTIIAGLEFTQTAIGLVGLQQTGIEYL